MIFSASDREPSLLQSNEFTFRNNDIASQYSRDNDQYRSTRPRQYAMRKNGQGRSENQHRPERGRGYSTATADRPLLK
jgi:hypothetical protein